MSPQWRARLWTIIPLGILAIIAIFQIPEAGWRVAWYAVGVLALLLASAIARPRHPPRPPAQQRMLHVAAGVVLMTAVVFVPALVANGWPPWDGDTTLLALLLVVAGGVVGWFRPLPQPTPEDSRKGTR